MPPPPPSGQGKSYAEFTDGFYAVVAMIILFGLVASSPLFITGHLGLMRFLRFYFSNIMKKINQPRVK